MGSGELLQIDLNRLVLWILYKLDEKSRNTRPVFKLPHTFQRFSTQWVYAEP